MFIFDRLGSISILKWNEIIGPTLIQDNKTGHKYDDAKPRGTTWKKKWDIYRLLDPYKYVSLRC